MKKALPFLFFIVFLLQSLAQVERDKALHFIGGNLYGLAGAGIAKQISEGNRWWTFAGSIGGATLIGLGKEAIDAGQNNNSWDNEDVLATILGGVTVGITIDIFTDHKKNGKRLQGNFSSGGKKFQKNGQYTRLDNFINVQETPSLLMLSLPSELLE